MSIPLSNTPFQNAYAAEFEELEEVISELTEIFVAETELAQLPQQSADLGGDSAFFTGNQSANFISEQIAPLLAPLAQQALINNGQLQLEHVRPRDTQTAPADLPQTHGSAEDPNITANYLFSLNPLQRVNAEMNKPSNRHDANRDSQQRNEMRRLLQLAGEADPVSDEELSPMIEAIVKQTPQVSIELPGGVELRITLDATGQPSVMYVNPDGHVRTLAKGKTLRLNRWVNGITVRADGKIVMLP